MFGKASPTLLGASDAELGSIDGGMLFSKAAFERFGFFVIFVSFLTVLCEILDFCHIFVTILMIFVTFLLHF